jgi:hypothetical protein
VGEEASEANRNVNQLSESVELTQELNYEVTLDQVQECEDVLLSGMMAEKRDNDHESIQVAEISQEIPTSVEQSIDVEEEMMKEEQEREKERWEAEMVEKKRMEKEERVKKRMEEIEEEEEGGDGREEEKRV